MSQIFDKLDVSGGSQMQTEQTSKSVQLTDSEEDVRASEEDIDAV
jgi:hypothetical protein